MASSISMLGKMKSTDVFQFWLEFELAEISPDMLNFKIEHTNIFKEIEDWSLQHQIRFISDWRSRGESTDAMQETLIIKSHELWGNNYVHVACYYVALNEFFPLFYFGLAATVMCLNDLDLAYPHLRVVWSNTVVSVARSKLNNWKTSTSAKY